MKRCLIFHVFNTLTERHLRLALESLARQQELRPWETFLLYNASTSFSDECVHHQFLANGLHQAFASYAVFPYDLATRKNVAADFMVQFRQIGGYDVYLVHKADFCLGARVLSALDEIGSTEEGAWFCNFRKYDIREYATDEQIRHIAAEGSYVGCKERLGAQDYSLLMPLPDAESIKTWAVGYEGMDGVMHAYSNAARPLAACGEEELNRSYGFCSIPGTMEQSGCRLLWDDRLYAAHVFHEVPGKYWDRCGKSVPGSRY